MSNRPLLVPLPNAEIEIFSYLSENFALAAENCAQLAWNPRRGLHFLEFLKNLRAIELACEQAAIYREDGRWLSIAGQIGECTRRVGAWVRGSKTKDERKEADKRFKKLSQVLRLFAAVAEATRTQATERVGMILPEPLEGPHREVRPVQVKSPGGIIIPDGTVLH
jgi:hypothetical protein